MPWDSCRCSIDYANFNVQHEPPWYGTVCPVVWEDGGGNPASYPMSPRRDCCYNTHMDSRTRVWKAIRREEVDRLPKFDALWEEVPALWEEQGMPAGVNPAEHFGYDLRMMHIDASARLPQAVLAEDERFVTYRDRAGYTVRKTRGKSRSLEFLDHATKDRGAWEAIAPRFCFDPAEPEARIDTASYFMHLDPYPSWEEARGRYEALRQTDAFVCFAVYGPWEALWRHRGFTQAMTDVLTDPEWVAEMAAAQVMLLLDVLRHAAGLGIVPDGLFLIEDLAHSAGSLLPPDAWRGIFGPLYHRIGAELRAQGAAFLMHCCGDCRALIPDLIEFGVEVLQPLQASAGMDLEALMDAHGGRMTFWGNIDVRAMAGPWHVCEAEVRRKCGLGRDRGGYIYHSDHSVPPEVSYEQYRRIMALVDEA